MQNLQEQVQEYLQKFVGERITPELVKKLQNGIQKMLEDLNSEGVLTPKFEIVQNPEDPTVIDVVSYSRKLGLGFHIIE